MLRRRPWLTAFAALCLTAFAAIYVMTPHLRASIVLLTEAEIADVELSFDRYRWLQQFEARPSGERFYAWDGVVLPGPRLRLTWRGPDGRQHLVNHRVLQQSYEPRCIHVIRLNSAAEAIAVGQRYDGSPSFVDTVCR